MGVKTIVTKRPMKWGTLDVPRGEEITLSDRLADGMIARGMATEKGAVVVERVKPKPKKKVEAEDAG